MSEYIWTEENPRTKIKYIHLPFYEEKKMIVLVSLLRKVIIDQNFHRWLKWLNIGQHIVY